MGNGKTFLQIALELDKYIKVNILRMKGGRARVFWESPTLLNQSSGSRMPIHTGFIQLDTGGKGDDWWNAYVLQENYDMTMETALSMEYVRKVWDMGWNEAVSEDTRIDQRCLKGLSLEQGSIRCHWLIGWRTRDIVIVRNQRNKHLFEKSEAVFVSVFIFNV